MKKHRYVIGILAVAFFFMLFTACIDQPADIESSSSQSAEEVSVQNNTSGNDTSEKQLWKSAYDQKLHEYYEEYNKEYSTPQSIYYDIHDLNGDGTPELILSEGDFHVAGCKLFTYSENGLILIGRMGENGSFSLYPESHILIWPWTGQGHHVEKWYILEGNELKLLFTEGYRTEFEKETTYEFNSTVVTEKEWNELKAQYSDYGPKENEKRIHLGRGNKYTENDNNQRDTGP